MFNKKKSKKHDIKKTVKSAVMGRNKKYSKIHNCTGFS